jgi:single-strand DNA-binding protein
MSTIKNRVQIVGNVGSTPELKVINNTKLMKLSVAVNEFKKYRNGETRNTTHWHKVTVWGKLAEQVQKLTQKGTKVLIDGKLKTCTYIDKLGKKQTMTEIVANEIVINYAPQAA